MRKEHSDPIFGTGPLARPLTRRRRDWSGEPVEDAEYNSVQSENFRRLISHYGYDPNKVIGETDWHPWAHLFLKLAFDCVPGLREAEEKKKLGRRPISGGAVGKKARAELWSMALEIAAQHPKRGPRLSDVELAKRIKKRGAPAFFEKIGRDTLRKHLALARREAEIARQQEKVIEGLRSMLSAAGILPGMSPQPSAAQSESVLAGKSEGNSRPEKRLGPK
jgi:hypothetical protein